MEAIPDDVVLERVSRVRRAWERAAYLASPWRSFRWGRDSLAWSLLWRAADPLRYAWWRLKNIAHPKRHRATSQRSREAGDELWREGIVTLPEFVDPDSLRALFASVRSYVKGKRGVDIAGPTGHADLAFTSFGNEMSPDDPVLAFVRSPRILEIASEFLGFHPRISRIGVFVNEPIEDYSGHLQVQKHWHIDTHDFVILKFFLYLTDVESTTGPFTFIPGTHYRGRHRVRFGRMPATVGAGLSSDEMQPWFPDDQWREATGKAGTAVFCSTSGLHRGGRVKHGRRVVLFAEYGSHHPWVRFDTELPRRPRP